MKNNRPEKHYSLSDEIINTIIELKTSAVIEAHRFDTYQHRKFNVPEGKSTPPEIMAEMFKDYLFGDYEFPARDRFDNYLDTLTDENLLDLVIVYYMGSTDDATLSIDPGEPRFLDYYYDSPHLWYTCRDGLLSTIHGKINFADDLRNGKRLLNQPKDPGWKPPRLVNQHSEKTCPTPSKIDTNTRCAQNAPKNGQLGASCDSMGKAPPKRRSCDYLYFSFAISSSLR